MTAIEANVGIDSDPHSLLVEAERGVTSFGAAVLIICQVGVLVNDHSILIWRHAEAGDPVWEKIGQRDAELCRSCIRHKSQLHERVPVEPLNLFSLKRGWIDLGDLNDLVLWANPSRLRQIGNLTANRERH